MCTVDDLGRMAREGLDKRESAVAQAEAIIETQVGDFMQWLDNRELVPTIRALRDDAERARRHEVERAVRQLARGDNAAIVLHQKRLCVARPLHAPANDAHVDFAGGRRFAVAAKNGTGQNGRQDDGGRRGLEELAAVNTFGGQKFFHGGV